jgi:ubiquinone/menaquinone biosynthesis C-methylase UbiE
MCEKIPTEDMHIIPCQKLTLTDFPASGYILDIGGGGEGIIGLITPRQVVAIDYRREELEEAPSGPLKIIMNATDLQFLDESFSTVTSFFTLMFMQPKDKLKGFQEIYRVLEKGGHFLIWDVIIPSRGESQKKWFVVPLQVTIGDITIETSYGVGWAIRTQNMDEIERKAQKTGFSIEKKSQNDQTFFYDLLKG